jgi:phage terminase small subunit
MLQRGRKSPSNVVVVDTARHKPDPPKHLSAEQKTIWKDIVGAMKPGHFPQAVLPLLEVYCCCVSRCRTVDQQLREVNPTTDIKRFRMLAAMQCRESMLLCSLSTRLRLLKPTSSHLNRHDEGAGVTKPWDIGKPWQDDDADEPA